MDRLLSQPSLIGLYPLPGTPFGMAMSSSLPCLPSAHGLDAPLLLSVPALPAQGVLTQLPTEDHVSQGRRPLDAQTFTSEPAAASRCLHAVASAPLGPAENF